MLFMALSGLFLWWPKKAFLKCALTFKFADKGKKFHRDLQGAAGFWLMAAVACGKYNWHLFDLF
jgi:uncharacterized iron-regulated membrane protein